MIDIEAWAHERRAAAERHMITFRSDAEWRAWEAEQNAGLPDPLEGLAEKEEADERAFWEASEEAQAAKERAAGPFALDLDRGGEDGSEALTGWGVLGWSAEAADREVERMADEHWAEVQADEDEIAQQAEAELGGTFEDYLVDGLVERTFDDGTADLVSDLDWSTGSDSSGSDAGEADAGEAEA